MSGKYASWIKNVYLVLNHKLEFLLIICSFFIPGSNKDLMNMDPAQLAAMMSSPFSGFFPGIDPSMLPYMYAGFPGGFMPGMGMPLMPPGFMPGKSF